MEKKEMRVEKQPAHFVNDMINEHSLISPTLKKFETRLDSREDIRLVTRDMLEFYYKVIRPHSHREDEEMLRKNPGMDKEGVFMSHRRLEEACDSLEQVFFTPGSGNDVLLKEARDFLEVNINHILEEENQFFVTDVQDIYERAGSY